MSKKSRRKRLFRAKVLAISGAAVFMVGGVNNLYANIQRSTEIKKEVYVARAVKTDITSTPAVKSEETRIMESIDGDGGQEIIDGVSYSLEDEYILAKIAMAEAESEGVEGKALVILVVLNRVQSDRFPDSISEVIFQRNQFTPVNSGRYNQVEPDMECYEALDLVQLKRWDESQGALYFESESASDWHKNNLHFLFQYGNHYFYTDKEMVE